MTIIKDPDWYLTNQDTSDKIYSNAIFFALGIYHIYRNNNLLGIFFVLLGFGSTAFHVRTSKETLLFDRITMILVFSYFFNMFYPNVSIINYSIVGILTVLYWYNTEELIFYFIFQSAGLLLYLIYFPMNLSLKLATIAAYSAITYTQLLDNGKYHSLKHIGLGLLSLTFNA